MPQFDGQSWCERMAVELAKIEQLTAGMIQASLEAAGELKCLELKTMLGRCYEIIEHSTTNDVVAQPDSDFMKDVAEAIK